MSVHKVNDLFSSAELNILYAFINSIVIPIKDDGTYIYDTDNDWENCTISKYLGRIQTSSEVPREVCDKLSSIAKSISSKELTSSGMTYVEYNKKYGTPNLPPHFDGDDKDLIINYQISSNTSWDIGVDLETHIMKDNSALVFNANKNIHWRPHKVFAEGDYVRMIFFRFQDVGNIVDNSHLRYSSDHEIYDEVNKLRDSL